MEQVWIGGLIVVMVLTLGLHIFSMPANWVVLAFVALWKWTHPEAFTWGFFLGLVALAATGEILEFVGQVVGGKKFGSTGRGNFGGIVGAIVGAVVCAPLFLGLGAIPGALGGAFLGCLIMEMGHGRDFVSARRAAWGAFWGKFFGMVVKIGAGVAMVVLVAVQLW